MRRNARGRPGKCQTLSLGWEQAEALAGLERAEAQHTAARAKILAVFTADQGFQADGYFGAKPWLRARTKITRRGGRAAQHLVGVMPTSA